jgi:histone deacetylase complex regulatory component SIN3
LGTLARMERADSLIVLDSKGKIVVKEAKMSFQAFVFRDMKNRIIDKSYFLHVRTIFRNRPKVIRILNANLTKNYNAILKLKTKTNRNEN